MEQPVGEYIDMNIMMISGILAVIIAILAFWVLSGRSMHWDERTLRAVHFHKDGMPKNRHPKMRSFMRDISALAGDTANIIIFLLLSFFFLAHSQYAYLFTFIQIMLIGRAAGWAIKKLARRKRPDFVSDAPLTHTSSFPSVHSLMAMIVFGWLCFILPANFLFEISILFNVLGGILILLVGWSRIYLAVHWPSDVISGWLIGLLVLLLNI